MTLLEKALEQEAIEPVDRFLADYLLELEKTPSEQLALLIALTSAQVRQGNVCLQLDADVLSQLAVTVDFQALESADIVGGPDATGRPLILDGQRLYLARYYAWEQQVIVALRRMIQGERPAVEQQQLQHGLAEQFAASAESPDWQRVAAALAVTRRFCIISGGPGTGKTYTVARLLKLLLEQAGSRPLRIALAAPTGKAAGRLTQSIADTEPTLLEQVEPAQTLHRLLGMRPGRVQPRYRAGNPLPLDMLIVDEVSMVDLPMMARLLAALPGEARLVLLGDRYQLASVEAGRVMADLCGEGGEAYAPALVREMEVLTGDRLPVAADNPPAMAEHVVVLRHSRRFDSASVIGRLAHATNRGDIAATLEILARENPQMHWLGNDQGTLDRLLQAQVAPIFQAIREADSPVAALEKLNELRVLCAVREGPQGVVTLNRKIEQALEGTDRAFYHGRPVMITVNDAEQQLFNGDIGLVLNDAEGNLRAYFSTGDNQTRAILPTRLPPHETVYAMTIHKSQGSEFRQIILVLPEKDSPVVTRELLYTGITRARESVTLCATEAGVKKAVGRQVQRYSGLYDALWRSE